MSTSLTRWWIQKTNGRAESFTTPDVFGLLLAEHEAELNLSRLRRIMARVLRLESEAISLAAQIQSEKVNRREEGARQTLPIPGGHVPTVPARPLQAS